MDNVAQPASASSTRIGVAVVQWNHVDHTLQLLSDLSPLVSAKFRIAVCDNGSESESWNTLRNSVSQQYSDIPDHGTEREWRVALMRNRNNSGFAAGINTAIRTLLDTDAEWLWLLNNDVRIDHTELAELLNDLAQREPGAYATTIIENGCETSGLNYFNIWTTRFRPLKKDEAQKALTKGGAYINGASIILHRDVIDAIGLLNEGGFLYFEELDYARRMEHSPYLQGLIESVTVRHIGAGSSSSRELARKRMYHETWSTLAFYKKHHPWLFLPILLFRTPVRIVLLILRKRLSETGSVVLATSDFVRGVNRDKRPIKIVEAFYCS